MRSTKKYNSTYRCWEWKNSQGQWHREDGPAIEYDNGDKYWYRNGLCHREDGPAVERSNGSKEWRLNGIKFVSAKEFREQLAIHKENESTLI